MEQGQGPGALTIPGIHPGRPRRQASRSACSATRRRGSSRNRRADRGRAGGRARWRPPRLRQADCRSEPVVAQRRRQGPRRDADVVAISLAVKRAIESMSGLLNPPAIVLESEICSTTSRCRRRRKRRRRTKTPHRRSLPPRSPGRGGVRAVSRRRSGDARRDDRARAVGTLRRQLAGPVTPEPSSSRRPLHRCAAAAIVVLGGVGAAVLSTPVSVPAFVLSPPRSSSRRHRNDGRDLRRVQHRATGLGVGQQYLSRDGVPGGGFIHIEGFRWRSGHRAVHAALLGGTGIAPCSRTAPASPGSRCTPECSRRWDSSFLRVGMVALRWDARRGRGVRSLRSFSAANDVRLDDPRPPPPRSGSSSFRSSSSGSSGASASGSARRRLRSQ